MGAKLGLVLIAAADPPLAQIAAIIASTCAEVGCTNVVLLYEPSLDVHHFVESSRRVGALVVSAEPSHPGVDAIGAALRDALEVDVLATYVNDLYQSGAYVCFSAGGGQNALLVDGTARVGATTVSYGEVPIYGLASLLEAPPLLDRHTHFPEDVPLPCAVRVIAGGAVLDPPRPLDERERDGVDLAWATGMVAFPSALRQVRRALAERVEGDERLDRLAARASVDPSHPLSIDAVERLFDLRLPPRLRACWTEAIAAGSLSLTAGSVLGLFTTRFDVRSWLRYADEIADAELAPANREHGPHRLLPFARFHRNSEDPGHVEDVVLALDTGRTCASNGADYEVVEVVDEASVVTHQEPSDRWLARELAVAHLLAAVLEASYEDDARDLLADAMDDEDHETVEAWLEAQLEAADAADESIRKAVIDRFFARYGCD